MNSSNDTSSTDRKETSRLIEYVIRAVAPHIARHGESLCITPDAIDHLAVESEGVDTGDVLEVVPMLRVRPLWRTHSRLMPKWDDWPPEHESKF
jgi:hypothetical protein